MATTATESPGKTAFVKQFLNANPDGTTKTVNEAWQAAGFDGTISPALVNKTRLKLTGNLRGKPRTAAQGEAVDKKPKTATATPGKTSFVKEFLHDNPQGNAKAVNEAWQAAGFDGTISHPIISQVRKQMGLTGKLPGKPRTAAKGKATAKKPKTATATAGKTMFVKEFLIDHPEGNHKSVNEAWTAAGFDGTISTALVYQARASLGLAGNLRGKTKKSKAKTTSTGKKLGRPRKEPTAPGRKSARTLALTELEADIDRLIFRVMAVGDLTEIETALEKHADWSTEPYLPELV